MKRLFAMLILTMLAAGCGGDSDAEDEDAATLASSTPAAQSAPAAQLTISPSASPTATEAPQRTATEARETRQAVLDILAADERFSILNEILGAAPPYFVDFMSRPDWNHTLFAPTNEAFEAIPTEALDAMRTRQVGLIAFLDHLILPVVVSAAELEAGSHETVGQGGVVEIMREDGELRVDEATVIEVDIEAANGVIHAIDTLIGAHYILQVFD